jgi:DNA helicase HerA-like ATPase
MPSYRLAPDPINTRGNIIAGDPAMRRKDRVLLGRSIEAGPNRELWLDVSGEQVVAVFGKRGTGKSYTLGVLLEGLSAGQGETQISKLETARGALVFDIMDIYWTSTISLQATGPREVVNQFKAMQSKGFSSQNLNIDVWIPSGFERPDIDPSGINQLQISPSELDLDDWSALFDVDIYTEPRGMLIADLVQHTRSGYLKIDGTTTGQNLDFTFQDLLECLESDSEVQNNYQDVTRRSIRQRMTSYAALSVFQGQTPLRDLLRPFRSSILMLGRVPDALKKVLVSVLLRGILRNRRDVSFARKRLDLDADLSTQDKHSLEEFVSAGLPRTWVLMDEAHVLAASGQTSVASEALVKYAKEGRNYGLSLAVATQQPSALDPRLLSQVETLVSHQLTAPADASIAARSMRSPNPSEILIDGEKSDMEGLLRRIGQGEAIFSCGNAPALTRSCLVSIRPRVTAHGGYEA